MKNDKSQNNWFVLALLFSIALILANQYFLLIEKPTLEVRQELHQNIIDGTAESPYRYRILAPYLAQGLSYFFQSAQFSEPLVLAYQVFDVFAIFASLLMLYQYLRNWFSKETSLIGVLIASLSMLVGFRDHYFQPWSLLEPAVFALGLNFLYQKRYGWLAMIIALGTLIRETAVFLVVSYFLTWAFPFFWREVRKDQIKKWLIGLGYIFIWALIFFGLRLILGEATRTITIREILTISTRSGNILKAIWYYFLFFGVFWWFIIGGYKRSPSFVKKTARLLPIYLALITLFAIWYEVRLIMTLYPIFIPLGLSYLFPPNENNPKPIE